MNRKQKQIRGIILVGLAVILVISVLISVKIRSADTKKDAVQVGKYDVQEINETDKPKETSQEATVAVSDSGIKETTADSLTPAAAESTVPAKQGQANSSDSAKKTDSQNTEEQDKQVTSENGASSQSQSSSDSQGSGTAALQSTVKQQEQTSVNEVQSGQSDQSGQSGQQSDQIEGTQTKAPAQDQKEYITCTIEIRCDALSENMSALTDQNLASYIPADGTILANATLKVEKGASVYDALAQVCQNHNIQLDTDYTPMYKSYYVKSIQYLYEKKAGSNSGWRYSVNGNYPGYGCSSYKLNQSDKVVWQYSLNLGQ